MISAINIPSASTSRAIPKAFPAKGCQFPSHTVMVSWLNITGFTINAMAITLTDNATITKAFFRFMYLFLNNPMTKAMAIGVIIAIMGRLFKISSFIL